MNKKNTRVIIMLQFHKAFNSFLYIYTRYKWSATIILWVKS